MNAILVIRRNFPQQEKVDTIGSNCVSLNCMSCHKKELPVTGNKLLSMLDMYNVWVYVSPTHHALPGSITTHSYSQERTSYCRKTFTVTGRNYIASASVKVTLRFNLFQRMLNQVGKKFKIKSSANLIECIKGCSSKLRLINKKL